MYKGGIAMTVEYKVYAGDKDYIPVDLTELELLVEEQSVLAQKILNLIKQI